MGKEIIDKELKKKGLRLDFLFEIFPGFVEEFKREVSDIVNGLNGNNENNEWVFGIINERFVVLNLDCEIGFNIAYNSHLVHSFGVVIGKKRIERGFKDDFYELNVMNDDGLMERLKKIVRELFNEMNDEVLSRINKRLKFRATTHPHVYEAIVGGVISEEFKKRGFKVKVDLENFDYEFELVINDYVLVYLKLFREMYKRDYRIFTSPGSVKASFGYGLWLIAMEEYEKRNKVRINSKDMNLVFLDFNVKDGVIVIEVALGMLKSPRYFDKDKFENAIRLMKCDVDVKDVKVIDNVEIYAVSDNNSDLTKVKSNAKIAGVNKLIHFSKQEVSWFDYKFDKSSVDVVVSLPKLGSKYSGNRVIEEFYSELFYQFEYILKRSSVVVMYVNKRTLDVINDVLNRKYGKRAMIVKDYGEYFVVMLVGEFFVKEN